MMMDESTMDLVRVTLLITLKIAMPILAAGVVIGLVVSILQSVTSIQDQSLAFVPKIVGMLLVAAMLVPWVIGWLMTFTLEMFKLH